MQLGAARVPQPERAVFSGSGEQGAARTEGKRCDTGAGDGQRRAARRASGGVPQPHCAVVAARSQEVASTCCGDGGDGAHGALVPAQHRGRGCGGVGAPAQQHAVVASRQQAGTVRGKGNAPDTALVAGQWLSQRRAAGGVPQTHVLVFAGAGQLAPVGAVGHAPDAAAVAGQRRAQGCAAGDIPLPNQHVASGRGQAPSVGAESQARDDAAVPRPRRPAL